MTSFKFIPWLIEKLVFPVGDALFGTSVSKELVLFRKYTTMSESELDELSKSKLQKLLKHATTTCEAYKQYSDNNSENWIKRFPILQKTDVEANTDSFISSKYKKENLITENSSGSTGTQSTVYLDKVEQSITRAVTIIWWEWNGFKLGQPILQTGMTPTRSKIKRLKDLFLRTTYINAFKSTEADMLAQLNNFRTRKGGVLYGYASSLYLLAKTANKHKVDLEFDVAKSFGDKLFSHYQTEIESAFKCKVVEDYGLTEGFMIAQRKDLPYFYIYTPSVYLEILDDEGNEVPDGEMGRVIATKLDGYAMPLIRYDTGDLGIKLPRHKYPEQRDYAFPLLEKIVGRNTDIIKTSDGKHLTVHTFTGIFEHYKGIKQFQIQQDRIDEIAVRYIPTDSFSGDTMARIESDLEAKTNCNIEVKWEKVNVISPSKSGKPEIVINNLVRPQRNSAS